MTLLLMLKPTTMHNANKLVSVFLRQLSISTCTWHMFMTALTMQLQLMHENMAI